MKNDDRLRHSSSSPVLSLIAITEETIVAQLIVRNLDDDIIQALKERAAERGHSAEEEHRRILQSVLRSEGLLDHLRAIPSVGDDGDFARQADPPRSVDL